MRYAAYLSFFVFLFSFTGSLAYAGTCCSKLIGEEGENKHIAPSRPPQRPPQTDPSPQSKREGSSDSDIKILPAHPGWGPSDNTASGALVIMAYSF